MVNNVKKNLQTELVNQLFKEELFEMLLVESEENSQDRQKTSDMLTALKKANNIINEVRADQSR